ncbi:MAG: hypothetical protein J7L52_07615 [Thermotogae bacterium]|nr:hypothetical protein [Thermotogota bacterium]
MQLHLLDLLEMVGDFEKRKDAFRKIYLSKLEEPEDFEHTFEDMARYRGRKYRKVLEGIYVMVVARLTELLELELEVEGMDRRGKLISRILDADIPCVLLSPWKKPRRISKEYRDSLIISFHGLPAGIPGITWRGLIAALRLKKANPGFVETFHRLLIIRDFDGVLIRMASQYVLNHVRKSWDLKEATSALTRVRSEQVWAMLRILAENPDGLEWEEIKEKFRERTGQDLGKRGFPAIVGVISRLSENHEPIVMKKGEKYVLHPIFMQIIRAKEAERR